MESNVLIVAALAAALAVPQPVIAQARYSRPETITSPDGFRYQRLGPNFYGNDPGPARAPAYGQGRVDSSGRPIYRGVTGGNTTNTTGNQNPWTSRGSYGAQQAQQDAARAEASRRAEFARRGIPYR